MTTVLTPTTIRAAKANTRKEIKASLSKINYALALADSRKIWRSLGYMNVLEKAKSVCLFLSMPQGEVQTTSIVQQCLIRGQNVYIPYVCDKERMDMVLVNDIDDLNSFERNSWGIPEASNPSERMKSLEADPPIDIIITPGVAFDNACNRCGHGRGYYDRYFARLEARYKERNIPFPTLIGVAFDQQIIEQVPMGETDRPLDYVITPSRIFSREQYKAAQQEETTQTPKAEEKSSTEVSDTTNKPEEAGQCTIQ